MIPRMCEGRRCSKGKPKPETLVNAVVVKNTAVRPSSPFPVRNPTMTINPEPIPIKLINTCRRVYVAVDMPRIMIGPFQDHGPNLLALAILLQSLMLRSLQNLMIAPQLAEGTRPPKVGVRPGFGSGRPSSCCRPAARSTPNGSSAPELKAQTRSAPAGETASQR